MVGLSTILNIGNTGTNINLIGSSGNALYTGNSITYSGNSGTYMSLNGNIDIANKLTFGNENIIVHGGIRSHNTIASYQIPNNGLNNVFVLLITGTATSQLITLPEAKSGNIIYIVNCSSNAAWNVTINPVTTNRIICAAAGPVGVTTITVFKLSTVMLTQITGTGFYVTGETVNATDIFVSGVRNTRPNSSFYLMTTGNAIQQFGNIPTGANLTGSFSIPRPYTTAPTVVLTSVDNTNINPAQIVSVTGTTINWRLPSIASGGINYMAIGTALVTP